MPKISLLLVTLFVFTFANAQSYEEDVEIHLLGPIGIRQIEAQPPYNQWFADNAKKFELPERDYDDLRQKLNALEVNVYFGTWCGDSQNWVPQLIRLWDKLSLDRAKLHLIALDGRSEHYKQGPNGEEKGQRIHRVPVFQFMKNGQEVGRIVETPKNDLLTDVAQIAFGYPSIPNFRAANYFMSQIDERGTDDIKTNLYAHYRKIMPWVDDLNEMNTLGNVYLRAGRMEEAVMVFSLNASFFPEEVHTNRMLARAEEKAGLLDAAKKSYQKILRLEPENAEAKNALERLEAEQ